MRPLLVILLLLCFTSGNSCTTFVLSRNGELVFGRNYDWVTDAGMLCTNQRGLFKTSVKHADGSVASWISRYASMSFIQYGKEFATGGMNERGLVVELMWLDGTKYPGEDNRPSMGVLQWIQYQLDNCATVSELIATDGRIRISAKGTAPIHYLVADQTGEVATIEFLEGKMVVHQGKDLPFPVLTNNGYEESVRRTSGTGSDGLRADNSLHRFAQACEMVSKIKEPQMKGPLTAYAFKLLDKVAQGSFTKWSIVYDIKNLKIQFRTERYKEIKTVGFSGFDFACDKPAKAYDLNQEGKGDIKNRFIDFSIELNQRIVEHAFAESNDRIKADPAEIRESWLYAQKPSCAPLIQ